jgi:hypothetical protein
VSSVRIRKAYKFVGFLILSLLAVFVFDQILIKAERMNADIISLHLTFEEHDRGVWTVVFSPDGNSLISGSRDKKALGEFLQYQFGYTGLSNGITARFNRAANAEYC